MRADRSMAAAVLALLAAATVATAAGEAEGFTGELELILEKALFQGNSPGDSRARLILELEADGGTWRRVWGMALNYNNGVHTGFVRESTIDGGRMRLKMDITLGPDVWIEGGLASYDVDLKREAGGRFAGTWEGTLRGCTISGEAGGRLLPPRPIRVKDFRPVQPGEHPRILFRKADLPRLRERAKTPFGRAYIEKAKASIANDRYSKDTISMGMLYCLTGETKWADEARQVVAGYGGNFSPDTTGSGGVGHRLVAVGITYDLCHDAWPKEFKDHVVDRLMQNITVDQFTLPIAFANYHPCSNYYGPGRGAPAIAALALYADKGPEPKKPLPPKEAIAAGDLTIALRARTESPEKLNAEYERALAKWKVEHREWQEAGGADMAKLMRVMLGRQEVYWHYRLGIGDGGFQAETGGYAGIGAWYPLVYATAYLNVFGRDASPHPDVTHLMPRRTMQVVFHEDGKTSVDKINSVVGFNAGWCAAAYPVVPDRYKPGLLWAWNKVTGAADEASRANVLIGGGLNLAHAFLHYPLDGKPVHPARSMPLTWRADDFGFYCFRSGWESDDDFVGQVFLKAKIVGGWNHPNAGTFRIMGLGHKWVSGSEGRNGVRPQEPVVLLPDDVHNEGACGKPAYLSTQADGSGVLTIDMTDVYGTTKTFYKTRAILGGNRPGPVKVDPKLLAKIGEKIGHAGLYDRNLLRLPENFVDSGIRGFRAIGFDYSGACGAPAMLVLIDRITGGGTKLWTWTLPLGQGGPRAAKPAEVRVEGGAFVLDHGDASMRATFVAPAGVRIEHKMEGIRVGDPRHGYHGGVNRIKATGGDCFFVVATIQRGAAPEVKVDGSGLGATVTVGKRTVRFDAGPPARIVLGP